MKIFRLLLTAVTAVSVSALSSCIQKEPLNTECDIETATLPERDLVRPAQIDDRTDDHTVTFIVRNYVDLTSLAPEFTVTPGATIEPASGTDRDFTNPQTYTVTSQDGEWSKTYTVIAKHDDPIALKYSFENVRLQTTTQGGTYDEFVELVPEDPADPTGPQKVNMAWASGNIGFALTNGKKGPETYPTFQADGGFTGKCAEMITRSTGTFGTMVGLPLAAGNLFIGVFEPKNATTRPLEATHFGLPFYQVPVALRGFYKYTAAAPFMELVNRKLVEVPGRVDECDIYGVFYERTADMDYLDGNNVLSDDNPNIIAIARLDEEERKGAADWTFFNKEFVYRSGKTLDPEKLKNGVYALAVVMTSSIEGAKFSGAIGSTLLVDEIEVVCIDK